MSLTLTYGSLNLTASPYLIEFGMDTGAPQNVYETLAFMLQDGEIELSSRASNRTLQFNVLIEGANLLALATAEAALVAETEKVLNTLTVDPGDSGPVTVFEIFRGQVTLARDDDGETARLRRYSVTVRAYPFVRSATEIVTAALAASGSTTTLVDNGSATTNWTGTINGGASTPSVVSGAVGLTSASVDGDTTLSLTRTASITTSSTKYLVVDYKPTTGSFVKPWQPISAYGDGVSLPQIASFSVGGGIYRATFFVQASSIAILRLDLLVKGWSGGTQSGPQVRTFFVDNINRTDIRPINGTARQQARILQLSGSAPAQGSLTISHASNALGDALVYVWKDPPEGAVLYSPPMRPYYSSGGTPSADATLVSGFKTVLTGSGTPGTAFASFGAPLVGLPAGSYLLMARAAAASGSFSGGFSWSARTQINAIVVDTPVTGTAAAAFTTTYTIYPVARLVLPVTDVRDPSTAQLNFTLTNTSTSSINLDEVWLFNTTLGQLTWVQCGTGAAASGGPSRRLVIDPASVDQPRPTVLRGHATDNSDAFYGSVFSWGQPRFVPPVANVFTVTTNTVDADAAFKYWPRWHTHGAT